MSYFRIYTKRVFEFKRSAADKTSERVQTAFMGFTTVPDWVRHDPMFKQGIKTGSIQEIKSAEQQKAVENGGGDEPTLEQLRARAAELKVPRASQLGMDKLKAAIAEAEAKLTPSPDLLADMDADALRQYAASNKIDLTGVAEDATADELRQTIKDAQTEGV
jgi:hypothetical protein